MNKRIIRVEEIEGGCHANQSISSARRDLEDTLLDDFGLKNGVDVFIDDDCRYQGHDAPSMEGLKAKQDEYYVFYLFKVGLTAKAEKALLEAGIIE